MLLKHHPHLRSSHVVGSYPIPHAHLRTNCCLASKGNALAQAFQGYRPSHLRTNSSSSMKHASSPNCSSTSTSRQASSLFCSTSGRESTPRSHRQYHATRRVPTLTKNTFVHATSPSAADGFQGPRPEPHGDLQWLSLGQNYGQQVNSDHDQGGRKHGQYLQHQQVQELEHRGLYGQGANGPSKPEMESWGNGKQFRQADTDSTIHRQPGGTVPTSPAAASTTVSASIGASAASWLRSVLDHMQALLGKLQQLDLTQVNLPISPATNERLRQALSIAATWPLSRPLVKYRNIATRVAVTIGMLAVIRCGLYIALPGVDLAAIPAALPAREGERLVRALYGQATALPASLFDLGISPYINASIFVVMVLAIPDPVLTPIKSLMRLKEARKQGRTGQAFITSVINALALLVAVYLALIKAYQLLPFAIFSASFVPNTAIALVAGSAIIQHCANIITSSGIGNGSSLVICMSIMDEYAGALHNMISRLMAGVVDLGTLATLLVYYAGLSLGAVYISRTELRLPTMQYASVAAASQGPGGGNEPEDEDVGMDLFAAARRRAELRMASRHTRVDYFPLQINSSGMMSIILAGAFWFVLLPSAAELCGLVGLQQGLLALQGSYWGLLIYGLFVMALEFAPLGGVNPKEVAEYLSAINVGIKGIIPGEPTEKYIQSQLLRCKFWGGLALGLLAVCAQLFDMACLQLLGASLSATSLLIIVGTVMQSSRQVESLLEGPRLNEKLSKEQALIQGLRAI